jgi:AraC-like DNA-binding protein
MRDAAAGLRHARALFDDAYAEPIRLDRAAAEAGLSKFHFVRAFRAAYGQTPHRYLTARRLEVARRLLAEGGRPVTAICFDVGFESLGSFSCLFRHATGMSPSAYRRGMRRIHQVLAPPAPPVVPSCMLFMLGGPHRA